MHCSLVEISKVAHGLIDNETSKHAWIKDATNYNLRSQVDVSFLRETQHINN